MWARPRLSIVRLAAGLPRGTSRGRRRYDAGRHRRCRYHRSSGKARDGSGHGRHGLRRGLSYRGFSRFTDYGYSWYRQLAMDFLHQRADCPGCGSFGGIIPRSRSYRRGPPPGHSGHSIHRDCHYLIVMDVPTPGFHGDYRFSTGQKCPDIAVNFRCRIRDFLDYRTSRCRSPHQL